MDKTQQIEWEQKAAEGNVEAQLALANLHEKGIDCPCNYEQAATYLQMAIRCGSKLATKKLKELVNTGKVEASWLDLPSISTPPPAQATAAPGSGAKLLLIDDEPELINIFKRSLEEAGFRIVTASNGDEGFQRVLQHPDIKVIICDMKMPKVNGVQFIRTLRGTKAAETAHIIVVSGMTHPEIIREAKQLRIAAWLVKPVDPDKLIQTIRSLLDKKA